MSYADKVRVNRTNQYWELLIATGSDKVYVNSGKFKKNCQKIAHLENLLQ